MGLISVSFPPIGLVMSERYSTRKYTSILGIVGFGVHALSIFFLDCYTIKGSYMK